MSSSKSMSRSASRHRSSSRISTSRDRIKWCKCKEFDHFANECPNSVTDEESDQYNSDSHTVVQILIPKILSRASSGEPIDH